MIGEIFFETREGEGRGGDAECEGWAVSAESPAADLPSEGCPVLLPRPTHTNRRDPIRAFRLSRACYSCPAETAQRLEEAMLRDVGGEDAPLSFDEFWKRYSVADVLENSPPLSTRLEAHLSCSKWLLSCIQRRIQRLCMRGAGG